MFYFVIFFYLYAQSEGLSCNYKGQSFYTILSQPVALRVQQNRIKGQNRTIQLKDFLLASLFISESTNTLLYKYSEVLSYGINFIDRKTKETQNKHITKSRLIFSNLRLVKNHFCRSHNYINHSDLGNRGVLGVQWSRFLGHEYCSF